MTHHANNNFKKKLGLAYMITIMFIIFTHWNVALRQFESVS